MRGIVLPDMRSSRSDIDVARDFYRPVHGHRAKVVVVDVDDSDPALPPVGRAEEKPARNRNGRAPRVTARVSRPRIVAGPRRPVHRLIRRPPPRAVDDRRVVVRQVDGFRIRKADDETRVLEIDPVLIGRRQTARGIRFASQVLHRIHDLRFLVEESIAEVFGPIEFLVHHVEDLRKRDQRFDARVPFGLLCRAHCAVAVQPRIAPRPTRRLDDFSRISRGHQDLRQQRIGIQRDRRQHLVELLLRKCCPALPRPVLLRACKGHGKDERH